MLRLDPVTSAVLTGALLLGLALCILMPPMLTPDARAHWARAVQVSEGGFVAQKLGPNRWGGTIPVAADELADRYVRRWAAGEGTTATAGWDAARAADWSARHESEFSNAAVFAAPAYLPQAVAIALARVVGANPLAAYWAGAAGNLLAYLALVGAALRLLPGFRLLTACLAVSPMMLTQAASVSADPVNFAVPLLLAALCWRLREQGAPVARAELVALSVLSLTLGLLKLPYLVFLAFLLLVPATGRARLILALAAVLAVAVALAWNAAFPFDPGAYFERGTDPAARARQLAADPLALARDLARTVRLLGFEYWTYAYSAFGGIPGRFHYVAPAWVPGASLGLFVALAAAESRLRRPAIGALFVACGVGATLATMAAFWLVFTPAASPVVQGVQGRYLLAGGLFVLIGMGLASPITLRGVVAARVIAALLIALDLAVIVLALQHYRFFWS